SANPVTIQGNANPNLQATINITSLTNGSITFSVSNVLVSGVSSTITGIGFDLPGVVAANSPGSCSGNCVNFGSNPTVTNTPGNVPQFGSVVLDWAVIIGPAFTGGNPPGISQGQSATFTVTGNFTGLSTESFLAGIYIRFQSAVDPNFPNVGSDVAHSTTTTVPEPATMLLLGAGLAGVASRLRNRRNSKLVVQEK
ncbi:MAG TPA: PEP-CTERM sorting domain-containing protein, partial [Pyrinomonadaceae bacterium]|nr:PEP-CTERM sorting domain-containing protein [Pyrinomonadaceae bacterium]